MRDDAANAAMPVRELAPAKINLTLSVLGRRADGYHELESLVTFADVHDVVTLEPGAPSSVVVAGPFAGYIGGENLLVRALALLADADNALCLGSVRLDKHLPVAAGIGGGSADAAALLRAVKRANPERAATVAWLDIATRLGADVPVCLGARPALMWGIGEKTEPLRRLPQAHAVLVNPGLPLSTADVFKALEAGPAPVAHAAPEAPDLAGLTNLIDAMRARGNDLERPATRLLPVIGETKAALEAEPGCHLAAMAGSGPTCFGIFADRPQADRAAGRIAGAHGGWWVRATVLQGCPAA
jgi:4-diphosphocytidyl-2-C-methyl-D-erythritol kinase